jgi:glycosidase
VLIRCFQYLIAAFDVDGFRIDTLKYLDRDFALRFGNAIREFVLSVSRKNFFTYGEVYDEERKISEYIGRNVSVAGDLIGVDASLDFPLFFRLPSVLKGLAPPSAVADMYQVRKDVERGIVRSHDEATRFFITFLDNPDQHARFHYRDPADPHRFDDQTTMAFACLFTLPGIPFVYYGTEQGLHGDGDESVREALRGMPGAFDETHPFFAAIRRIGDVRDMQPAPRPVGSTGPAEIHEGDGSVSPWPARVLPLDVAPMEAQIFGRAPRLASAARDHAAPRRGTSQRQARCFSFRNDELTLRQQADLPQDPQNLIHQPQHLRRPVDCPFRRIHLPGHLGNLLTQHREVLNCVHDIRILVDDFQVAEHQLLLAADQLLILGEETIPVVA